MVQPEQEVQQDQLRQGVLRTEVLEVAHEVEVLIEVLATVQEVAVHIEALHQGAVTIDPVVEVPVLEVVVVTEAQEVVQEVQAAVREVLAVRLGLLVEDHLLVQVEVVEEEIKPKRLNPIF